MYYLVVYQNKRIYVYPDPPHLSGARAFDIVIVKNKKYKSEKHWFRICTSEYTTQTSIGERIKITPLSEIKPTSLPNLFFVQFFKANA